MSCYRYLEAERFKKCSQSCRKWWVCEYFFTSKAVNSYQIDKASEIQTHLDLIEWSISVYDHQKCENEDFATLKFQLKTCGFVTIFQHPIWPSFFKISIFSLFFAYNLMSRAVRIFLYRSLKKVPTGILNFLHHFLSWNFFSKDLLKRFLWALKHVGVYEKNLNRTTHQSDYMPEKVKELRFWKNETQHWDRIFWQNLMF